MTEDGFFSDGDSLLQVGNKFRAGAGALDLVRSDEAPAVDAGASSELVAEARVQIRELTVATAQHLDETAGKVDAAEGSYADIENTAEGQLRYEQQRMEDE